VFKHHPAGWYPIPVNAQVYPGVYRQLEPPTPLNPFRGSPTCCTQNIRETPRSNGPRFNPPQQRGRNPRPGTKDGSEPELGAQPRPRGPIPPPEFGNFGKGCPEPPSQEAPNFPTKLPGPENHGAPIGFGNCPPVFRGDPKVVPFKDREVEAKAVVSWAQAAQRLPLASGFPIPFKKPGFCSPRRGPSPGITTKGKPPKGLSKRPGKLKPEANRLSPGPGRPVLFWPFQIMGIRNLAAFRGDHHLAFPKVETKARPRKIGAAACLSGT